MTAGRESGEHMIGFIVFIIVMIVLGQFLETIDNMKDLAPYISALLAAYSSYKLTRRIIEQRKAEKERDYRAELKEELLREIEEERNGDSSLPETKPGTTEEPYYPEVKYFNK